jgi:hypothetical protein
VFAIDQTAGAPRSYEELRARAVGVEVFGGRIMVAHPEDLIRMKLAASEFRDRPEAKRRQDLDDSAVLERLRGISPDVGSRDPAREPSPGPDERPNRRGTLRPPPGRGPSIGR